MVIGNWERELCELGTGTEDFPRQPGNFDSIVAFLSSIETRSAPAVTRCYPCSFTFYLGNPFPRFLVF